MLKYSNKLNLLGQSVELDLLRDNLCEYWLLCIGGLKGQRVSFTIPQFIYGVAQPFTITECLTDNKQIEGSDKLKERLDYRYWALEDKLPYQFGLKNFIDYYNSKGQLTIVGNGNSLNGSVEALFTGITVEKLEFKNLDIQNITILDNMFNNAEIKYLSLEGIKFGKIKSMERVFTQSHINNTIDLSMLDIQECKTFNSCFKCCRGVQRIILPRTQLKVDTDMTKQFNMCYDLEDVNIQDIQQSQLVKNNSMFKRCDKLEKINLSGFTDIDRPWIQINNCKNLKHVIISKNTAEKQGITKSTVKNIEDFLKAQSDQRNVQITFE